MRTRWGQSHPLRKCIVLVAGRPSAAGNLHHHGQHRGRRSRTEQLRSAASGVYRLGRRRPDERRRRVGCRSGSREFVGRPGDEPGRRSDRADHNSRRRFGRRRADRRISPRRRGKNLAAACPTKLLGPSPRRSPPSGAARRALPTPPAPIEARGATRATTSQAEPDRPSITAVPPPEPNGEPQRPTPPASPTDVLDAMVPVPAPDERIRKDADRPLSWPRGSRQRRSA